MQHYKACFHKVLKISQEGNRTTACHNLLWESWKVSCSGTLLSSPASYLRCKLCAACGGCYSHCTLLEEEHLVTRLVLPCMLSKRPLNMGPLWLQTPSPGKDDVEQAEQVGAPSYLQLWVYLAIVFLQKMPSYVGKQHGSCSLPILQLGLMASLLPPAAGGNSGSLCPLPFSKNIQKFSAVFQRF